MLPLIGRIREAVDCAVAMQPVPYRTNAAMPTMESLRSAEGERAFPVALDPHLHPVRDGAVRAARPASSASTTWVSAAAAGPHHVRAMAEALGREVPASQYSPSMDLHPMFRADLAARNAAFLHSWDA